MGKKFFTSQDFESVRKYLALIARISLLTREEEAELVNTVRNCRLKAKVEAATERLVVCNLRFVVKIAGEYRGCGLDFMDLIQEGNRGLMAAIKRYNPEFGTRLTTYAVWWIRQYIRKALNNQSRTIRIPASLNDKLMKMRKAANGLAEKLGREPTEEEVAFVMHTTPRAIERLRMVGIAPTSIHSPLDASESESETVADRIVDPTAEGSDVEASLSDLITHIKPLLDLLPERERSIITLRYGLSGGEACTLEEIGAKFGITRERIRQVEGKAIRKLREYFRKIDHANEYTRKFMGSAGPAGAGRRK